MTIVDPPQVALTDIRQTLRITMADYPALLVISPLQQQLQRSAPGIDLVIQPWSGGDAVCTALIDGVTDLAISFLRMADDSLHREELFVEHYLIAMRAGHPAANAFSLETWLDYPHILVSGRGDTRTPTDDELAKHGLSRRIGVVVPTFQMVPRLLLGSDMIALLPSRILPDVEGLISFQPPVPVEGFPMHLAWHQRRTKDVALRHVANILGELLR